MYNKMSSYTNLEQHLIDRSTTFFNKLDINSSGTITIQQIIDACVEDSIKSYGRYVPPWLITLSQDYASESIISKQDYIAKKTTTPDLFLEFSEIDIDNNDQITFKELYDKYLNILSPPPIEYFYISKSFIELIKTEYNLTNESTITLQQLLTYENDHNITRYWPI